MHQWRNKVDILSINICTVSVLGECSFVEWWDNIFDTTDRSTWVAIVAVPNVAQLEIFTVEESL